MPVINVCSEYYCDAASRNNVVCAENLVHRVNSARPRAWCCCCANCSSSSMADSLAVAAAALHEESITIHPAVDGYDAFVLRLERLARPDLQQSVKKQCDLWSFVWTSTTVLADVTTAILRSTAPTPTMVAELGAGCGLSSLSACAVGAAGVLATDLVPDALSLLARNATLNSITAGAASDTTTTPADDAAVAEARLVTHVLDFNNAEHMSTARDWLAHRLTAASSSSSGSGSGSSSAPAQLLITGADILFASWTVKPVLRCAHALLQAATTAAADATAARGPAAFLLVDPGRAPAEDVEGHAAECGLSCVRRVDLANLPTPVALMRQATLFLLVDADAEAEAAAAAAAAIRDDGGLHALLAAFDAAVAVLSRRCLDAAAVAALPGAAHTKFGFAMAPHKAPAASSSSSSSSSAATVERSAHASDTAVLSHT